MNEKTYQQLPSCTAKNKIETKRKQKNYLDLMKSTKLNIPIYRKHRHQSNMLSKTMGDIIIKIQTEKLYWTNDSVPSTE